MQVFPAPRLARSLALPVKPVPPRSPNQLLILGGSQGARHLNEAVAEWVSTRPTALAGWHLIHQTGVADREAITQRYSPLSGFLQTEVVEFIADPAVYYRTATLVIARAGATSLAELACLAAPTVLVPLPSAARDHQTANARWYADRDAIRQVTQAATPLKTALKLSESVTPLLSNHTARQNLSHSMTQVARFAAAQEVADIILELASPPTATI